jgi:hypothetical protein
MLREEDAEEVQQLRRRRMRVSVVGLVSRTEAIEWLV